MAAAAIPITDQLSELDRLIAACRNSHACGQKIGSTCVRCAELIEYRERLRALESATRP